MNQGFGNPGLLEDRLRAEGESKHGSPPHAGSTPTPKPIGQVQRVTGSQLRKRFRLSDFLAEKLITAVAFVSLATIVMIFIFVFREAVPIFFAAEEVQVSANETVDDETYGEEYLGETARLQGEQRKSLTSAET